MIRRMWLFYKETSTYSGLLWCFLPLKSEGENDGHSNAVGPAEPFRAAFGASESKSSEI